MPTADSNGEWSLTTSALSKTHVHSFTATATDVAGNVGQSGAAVICSTPGNDILTGGGGTDTFVFSSTDFGKDVITDFHPRYSGHDVLKIDHSIFASAADVLAHATQVGNNVVITYDAADTITLDDVHLAHLTTHDIWLV